MSMQGIRLTLLGLAFALFGMTTPAQAADGATIVFSSGQVVRLQDGFKDLAPAFRRLSEKSGNREHQVVQLTLNGNTFLLNLAEVVILCRDDCRGLNIEDKRDPARQRR